MRRCSLPDCSSKHYGKGFCQKHHRRLWAHGSTDIVKIAAVGASDEWLRCHVSHEGEECLIWPFGKSGGYGCINYNGKMHRVHRLMCILAHGEPQDKNMHAAHSCGNGHLGCVNPRHLSWKTPKENQADRLAHGTGMLGESGPKAKLTEAQVLEIHNLRRNMTLREISEIYGVTTSAISLIVSGKNWPHIKKIFDERGATQ